jgi:hypothetical protein
MRANIHRAIIFVTVVLYASVAYTQNKTIDSLQKVLQTQKEDTSKVNTLNALSLQLMLINEYGNGYQAAVWAMLFKT